MKKIAIIGTGPTGIYTFFSLFKNKTPVDITLYERADKAGVGMPYAVKDNSHLMLANIASIEIPPLFETWLEWLKSQSEAHLLRYGVDAASLHERQFLPRILLGEYFRDQFRCLVEQAREAGFRVNVLESCEITDIQTAQDGVTVWSEKNSHKADYDLAVIATGHVWPDDDEATRSFFPSPWSGLIEANIPAGNVGILGVSLSAIDAAMAVVAQHGTFSESEHQQTEFHLSPESQALKISLLSRSGILAEADFYCEIPYLPLKIMTEQAVSKEISYGTDRLLDRIFALMVEELKQADPDWCARIALQTLNADTFSDAWFADRKAHNPFQWAEKNLHEVERNKRERHTVPWRYTILRLHEVVEDIVPHLNEDDRKRFSSGLARVFIDNYTAIPSESIRRLLALREAGIISIHALGQDYTLNREGSKTFITGAQGDFEFDTFIDARGQKPLKTRHLPFPTLREQLEDSGEDFPEVADDYTLLEPESARGRIAFAAIPYLMHDRPFVQGLTVSAEMGESIAKTALRATSHPRRRLPFIEL